MPPGSCGRSRAGPRFPRPRRAGSRASPGSGARPLGVRRGGVDALLEAFAGLEGEDLARGDLDGVARLRIAAPPRRLAPDAEVSEADDLDVLALLEAAEDDVEHRFDHGRGLALAQPVRGNGVDQVVLGHGGDSPPRRDGYDPPRAMNGL